LKEPLPFANFKITQMKKVLAALIILAFVATSCNRSVTIQQAANGKGRCGWHLK
jgi:hypothetical protein